MKIVMILFLGLLPLGCFLLFSFCFKITHPYYLYRFLDKAVVLHKVFINTHKKREYEIQNKIQIKRNPNKNFTFTSKITMLLFN